MSVIGYLIRATLLAWLTGYDMQGSSFGLIISIIKRTEGMGTVKEGREERKIIREPVGSQGACPKELIG